MPRRPTDLATKQRAVSLAARIAAKRQNRAWTQEDLATASRVGLDTVRAIEQHRTASPGVFLVVDLARALEVTVEELTS